MTNRFLISVAAVALIAGTGLANAQGAGGGSPSAGSSAQHSAPSSERGAASSGTMQHDTGGAAGSDEGDGRRCCGDAHLAAEASETGMLWRHVARPILCRRR